MKRSTAAAFILFLQTTAIGVAQNTQTFSTTWTPRRSQMQLSNLGLKIHLPATDYVIGLVPTNTQTASAAIGMATISTVGNGGARMLVRAEDIPDSLRQMGIGEIRLLAPPLPANALIVHVTVPAQTIVEILQADGQGISQQVQSPIFIRNGVATPMYGAGLGSVIRAAVGMKAPTQLSMTAPGVQLLPDGRYVAPLGALVGNRLATSIPTVLPNLEEGGIAVFQIAIDSQGHVSGVTVLKNGGLQPQNVEILSGSIRNWTFTPFLRGVSPVPVLATVPMTWGPNGPVQGPLGLR